MKKSEISVGMVVRAKPSRSFKPSRLRRSTKEHELWEVVDEPILSDPKSPSIWYVPVIEIWSGELKYVAIHRLMGIDDELDGWILAS